MANDYINKALDTLSEGLFFDTIVPLTWKENTQKGLMESLLELKDNAFKWRYPDACCASSNCRNILKYCNVSKAIYYKDPSFYGYVNVICNNKKIRCSLKYHPDCWNLIKNGVYSQTEVPDTEVLGRECSNSLCKNAKDNNVIVKIETYDKHAKKVSTVEAEEADPGPPVTSGVTRKEVHVPTLARIERPSTSRQRDRDDEETDSFKDKSPMEKLLELRKDHFGPLIEPDVLMNLENKDLDKTDQVHRFLYEILYEFVKSQMIITKESLILKWSETKKIFSDRPNIYNICDLDIPYLLLKNTKLMMLGEFICIPPIFNELLTLMETETTRIYRELENNADDQFYSRYNERILELFKERYQKGVPSEVVPLRVDVTSAIPSSSAEIGTVPSSTDENITKEEFFRKLETVPEEAESLIDDNTELSTQLIRQEESLGEPSSSIARGDVVESSPMFSFDKKLTDVQLIRKLKIDNINKQLPKDLSILKMKSPEYLQEDIDQLDSKFKLFQKETIKDQKTFAVVIKKQEDLIKLLKSRSQDVTDPTTIEESVTKRERQYKDYFNRHLELKKNELIKALEGSYTDYKNKSIK